MYDDVDVHVSLLDGERSTGVFIILVIAVAHNDVVNAIEVGL
jgi:hypothetical protein